MKAGLLIFVVAAVSTAQCLTDKEYENAVPGHMENNPEFRKRFPNIPGPISHLDSRIVGGVESVPNSRPHQVALFVPVLGGTSFCGGSLINARTVLTAAHCVDAPIGNVTVHLGAHNMPPGNPPSATVVTVLSGDIVVHPEWNMDLLLNDIALVRFDDPVPLSVNIQPIPLPTDNSHDYLGNTTLVSGWGRPSDTIFTISPVLREVTTPVISNYACRLAYLGTVVDSHICTSGALERGTCQGDSGGPLTINDVLVGVVSFGSSWGCAQGWPAAYTRVTNYLDWIQANQAPV